MFIALGNEYRALGARIQAAREVFWSGDRDLGFEKLIHARELAEKGGDPRLLAWSAVALAESHLAESHFAEAARWARIGIDHLNAFGLGLADAEGAVARETFASLYTLGIEAAWFQGDGDQVYEFIERGRASSLLAALGGNHALRTASIPPHLREAEDVARAEVASASERRSAAQRGGGADLRVQRRHVAELRAARGQLKEAVSNIRRNVRLQADLAYQGNVTVEECQQSLRDDEALVLFSPATSTLMVAVVVTPAAARIESIGTIAEVESAVKALESGEPGRIDPRRLASAQKLLVGRLGLEKTVKRLLISPSPRLAYVPFSLLDPSREVACVPSATVHGMLRTVKERPGARVLALGDPDYGAVSSIGSASGAQARSGRGNLTRLPATRAEVEAVGDVVLVGKSASETRFRELVTTESRWRAIHFACHGIVDAKQPTLCSLELARDGENDGSLWALEVFRTRVPADLVVLSACETGRGRYVRGEGIIGLVRAFMQAGVPRVICSLWKVDDEATQALMIKFYELWNPPVKPGDPELVEGSDRKGLGAAEALKQAQAFVRNHADHPEWKHPYYWAAWVLWGVPD